MLLRFYRGLSFVEVGARLNLKENTARMRVERALERLRRQLGRLGITSTGAALGIALADPAFSAHSHWPPQQALAARRLKAASSSTGGIAALILMNKSVLPILSAVVASALTTVFWTARAHGVHITGA